MKAHSRWLSKVVAALVAVVVVLVGPAMPASAHVDLLLASPAPGSTVDGPVEVLRLSFSGKSEIVGEGIVLLDADGQQLPAAVLQVSDLVAEVRPTQPLADGFYGVRWTAKAPDAHPRTGSYSFSVASSAGSADLSLAVPGPLTESLDSAVAGQPARWVGLSAQALGFAAILFALGLYAFSAFVLVGDRQEIRHLNGGIRIAAVVALVALGIEMSANLVDLESGRIAALASPSAWAALLTGPFAIGIALRSCGLAAVAAAPRMNLAPVRIRRSVGAAAAVQSRSPASVLMLDRSSVSGDEAGSYRPAVESSPLLGVGVVAVLASFPFIGHTAEASNRWVAAAADIVHVGTAAAWAGGVATLAWVIRSRRGTRPESTARMVLDYSVLAGVALVLVSLAGTALAIIEFDSIGQVVSTNFGRILLLKVGLVAVAALIGGRHHLSLVPEIEAGGDRAIAGIRSLRRSIVVEVVVFAAIIGVTSALVNSGMS